MITHPRLIAHLNPSRITHSSLIAHLNPSRITHPTALRSYPTFFRVCHISPWGSVRVACRSKHALGYLSNGPLEHDRSLRALVTGCLHTLRAIQTVIGYLGSREPNSGPPNQFRPPQVFLSSRTLKGKRREETRTGN